MNTKTLAIAIALAAGTAFASNVQAASIATLDTVQVRPSADQIAQAEVERNSAIPTLSLVEVRPGAGLIADYRAELAAGHVTTLAAVNVRPTTEQRLALAAEQASRAYVATLTAAATAVAHEVIVNLPALQVRPSAADVQALALETAVQVLVAR